MGHVFTIKVILNERHKENRFSPGLHARTGEDAAHCATALAQGLGENWLWRNLKRKQLGPRSHNRGAGKTMRHQARRPPPMPPKP